MSNLLVVAMFSTDFRTIVKPQKSEKKIAVGSGVFFMGSCFAENIGSVMQQSRFPVMINPHGVLYNPASLSQALESIVDNERIDEEKLHFLNGHWHSFMHHGKFSHLDAYEVVHSINDATNQAHQFLQRCEFLVITFGTAFVYQHKELRKVVANCHKFPSEDFERYQLHADEIVDLFKETLIRLRILNPTIEVILSVSPVRHLRDGAQGNQLSKSTLLLGQDKLVSLFDRVNYFPAYEIMMDDLRDYRFYDASMLQPNEVAIDYIWRRFSETYLDDSARSFYKQVQKVVRARNHRPLGHEKVQHSLFLSKQLEIISSLLHKYPESMLQEDKRWFEDQLDLYE
ncbi:MAG TPA: GSCFA domain-containing protein [Marinilabiliaceae bacterium]|nr:GSCFA domain-containing protein [Marinilabiliaceae bacterium]